MTTPELCGLQKQPDPSRAGGLGHVGSGCLKPQATGVNQPEPQPDPISEPGAGSRVAGQLNPAHANP